jgi:hypothetical protein
MFGSNSGAFKPTPQVVQIHSKTRQHGDIFFEIVMRDGR